MLIKTRKVKKRVYFGGKMAPRFTKENGFKKGDPRAAEMGRIGGNSRGNGLGKAGFDKRDKRGVGRPKGSKDKINLLRDVMVDALLEKAPGTQMQTVLVALYECLNNKPEQVLNAATKLIPNTLELDNSPEYAPVILDGQFEVIEEPIDIDPSLSVDAENGQQAIEFEPNIINL